MTSRVALMPAGATVRRGASRSRRAHLEVDERIDPAGVGHRRRSGHGESDGRAGRVAPILGRGEVPDDRRSESTRRWRRRVAWRAFVSQRSPGRDTRSELARGLFVAVHPDRPAIPKVGPRFAESNRSRSASTPRQSREQVADLMLSRWPDAHVGGSSDRWLRAFASAERLPEQRSRPAHDPPARPSRRRFVDPRRRHDDTEAASALTPGTGGLRRPNEPGP